jgi:purine-nucleoside phosphorylase
MTTPQIESEAAAVRDQLPTAVATVRAQLSSLQPQFGIILGSGLGGLAADVRDGGRIPFQAIPGFAKSTAAGHRGELVFGFLQQTPVIALAGRFHRYEGWSNFQVGFPIRLLGSLGVKRLIVSNAAGGLRPHYQVGDLLVIRDHINLIPDHQQCCEFIPRGATPYSPRLASLALAAGRQGNIPMHEGTYLATLGPTYETRAEYRMMRRMGADCVGMSTVPEVLQAQREGIEVLALSMISNVARPDAIQETSHQEVLDAGKIAEPRMRYIVQRVLATSCTEHV